jgi:hypothetical protein
METTPDQSIEESGRPLYELRADTHNKQDGRVGRIAALLIGDVDAGGTNIGGDTLIQH